MKKIYQNPETTIVTVELSNMIAASLGGVTESGGTTTLTNEQAESGTASWSRSTSVWGDDEEEF